MMQRPRSRSDGLGSRRFQTLRLGSRHSWAGRSRYLFRAEGAASDQPRASPEESNYPTS
jgi:hypothetical protein